MMGFKTQKKRTQYIYLRVRRRALFPVTFSRLPSETQRSQSERERETLKGVEEEKAKTLSFFAGF